MKKWLLSDSTFDECTDHYDDETTLFAFTENGVICPRWAHSSIYGIRFQYCPHPDCPACKEIDDHWKLGPKDTFKCKKCHTKFSITSGTYLNNSKLEFYYWWRFAFLVGEMNITNSCAIARDLEVSQKTAWAMIETLRTARKETSEIKFTTGTQVLSFKHNIEVLEILLKQSVSHKIKKVNTELSKLKAEYKELDRQEKQITDFLNLSKQNP